MALCLTCNPKTPFHSFSTKKAQWLIDNNRESAIPKNAPSPTSKIFYPKNCTVKIKVTVPGKDRKVLFWGALPRPISSKIPNALNAYGNYANMGVAKVKKGVLTLLCQAPRCYHEDGKTWPCHIHYVNPSKDLSYWESKTYAVAAYPGHYEHGKTKYSMTCINSSSNKCSILTPEQVYHNWNKLIVVNALPNKYPTIQKPLCRKKGINIPYTASKNILNKASKLIGDKPYVVYCMHSKCHAASTLIERLMQTKYAKNVYYMPAGQIGWTKYLNQKCRKKNK